MGSSFSNELVQAGLFVAAAAFLLPAAGRTRPIRLWVFAICAALSTGCISAWPNDHLRSYPRSEIVRLCDKYHFSAPGSLWANDDGTAVFVMEVARYSGDQQQPSRILKFTQGAGEPELIAGVEPRELDGQGQPIAQKLARGEYLFANSAKLSHVTLVSNSGGWALIRHSGHTEIISIANPAVAAYTFDGDPHVGEIVSRYDRVYVFSSPSASGLHRCGWEFAAKAGKLSITREFGLPGNFDDMDLDESLVLTEREIYPLWWTPVMLNLRTGRSIAIMWPLNSYHLFLYEDWFAEELKQKLKE